MSTARARRQSQRRRRTVGVLVLCTAMVVGGGWAAWRVMDESEVFVRERCTAQVGTDSFVLAPDQTATAALIAAVSIDRGLPARAASIGIATGYQESKLRNIDYGDQAGPDSRGVFQQRPSQGWGTEEQVMDPVYAANRFFQELETLVPNFEDLDITVAAQRVQRSAYPEAYADHEPEGRAYASALTGHSPAGLNCVLKSASAPGDAAGFAAALTEQLSDAEPVVAADGSRLTLAAESERGWALVQWAVANAQQFGVTSAEFGGLRWERAQHGWVSAEDSAGTSDTVTVTFQR